MNKWESLCWKSIECKRRKMKEKSDRKVSEWGASRLKHETRLSQIDFCIRSVVRALLRDFPELAFFSCHTRTTSSAACLLQTIARKGQWNVDGEISLFWFDDHFFASYSFPPTRAAVSRLSSQLLFSSKCIKQLKSKCFSYFCSPLFFSRVRLETIMRWRKKIPEHNKKWKRLIIEETVFIFGKQVAGISQFHPKMQRCKSPRRPVERFIDVF